MRTIGLRGVFLVLVAAACGAAAVQRTKTAGSVGDEARRLVSGEQVMPDLRGQYFGQTEPGLEARPFIQEIIPAGFTCHGAPIFSADGREAFWAAVTADRKQATILTSRLLDDRWTAPKAVPFSSTEFRDIDPILSPDQQTLLFTSLRPLDAVGARGGFNIWSVRRVPGGWAPPAAVASTGNTGRDARATITGDGTIYFGSWRDGTNRVYWISGQPGRESRPAPLGEPASSDEGELPAFVAPDGSYLLLESPRRGGQGGWDLWVTFRTRTGGWSAARNLGPAVNSSGNEGYATVSPDGRYLFFVSSRDGRDRIYWVDARVLQKLRPEIGRPS